VPVAAGGITDIVARITAEYIATKTGQQVIVENRTGAGGNLGVDAVAKAGSDGYTLAVVSTGNVVINPFVFKNLTFDPLNDLVPVAPIGEAPQLLIVNAGNPAKSLRDFIAQAKAKPLTYGSAGPGSTMHLAADQFGRLAGAELTHVPYRGAAPAVTDLVSGNIEMISVSAGPVIQFIRASQLRALVAASKKRDLYLPETPTSAEAGLPGYEMTTWFGLFAPAGTPTQIVQQLNRYVGQMLDDPAIRKRLDDAFVQPLSMSVEDFAGFVKTDYDKWGRIVREAGLRPE
jgi:tripartite-type tricarboxylate transporter receptor subunit TctC